MMLSLCRALSFVYPYGATLSVMKPAVAILSTGSVCFPLNRPVLAFYEVKVRSIIHFPHLLSILYSCGEYVLVTSFERYCMSHLFLMKEGGKLAVLGSCHMFSDQYLDKEENSKIMVNI